MTKVSLAHLETLERAAWPPLATYSLISVVMLYRLGPPILILVIPFAVAYATWLIYGWKHPVAWTDRLHTLYILLFTAQMLHLSEEFATGFQVAFPALWGAVLFNAPGRFHAWDITTFVLGNLIMDALWMLAMLLLPRRNAWANFTLWLLIAGMLVNAVGHPLYTLYTGTHAEFRSFLGNAGLPYRWYFPGFWTAFAHALLVTLLLRELKSPPRIVEPPPNCS